MPRLILLCTIALFALHPPLACLHAADWNQWRGPARNGLAAPSPRLIDALPPEGIEPLWTSEAEIPSARDGGFASPVVADGRVYLFAPTRTRVADADLPPQKYPYLPPEKRGGMTDEEYAQYEQNRRDEQQARSKNFRYDEKLLCIDAQSGKTIWTNEREGVYTRWPQSGTPAVIDGRVYFLGAARVARCVDAISGKDVWETRLPGEFRDEFHQSSVAVADGVALFIADHLFGLDARGGTIVWEGDPKTTRTKHTSPVVFTSGNRELVIVHVGRDTICIDPKDGNELWRVPSQASQSTPLIVGTRLLTYGSSRKGGLRCFEISADGASPLWIFTGAADQGSTPVAVDGHVYVQGEKRLACVDLATGKARWTTTLPLDRPRYASLIAADGKIFFAWEGLYCFAANPKKYQPSIAAKIDADGLLADEAFFRRTLGIAELERTGAGQAKAERLWQKTFRKSGPLRCTTPALADGRLYLRTQDDVVCYDLTAIKTAKENTTSLK